MLLSRLTDLHRCSAGNHHKCPEPGQRRCIRTLLWWDRSAWPASADSPGRRQPRRPLPVVTGEGQVLTANLKKTVYSSNIWPVFVSPRRILSPILWQRRCRNFPQWARRWSEPPWSPDYWRCRRHPGLRSWGRLGRSWRSVRPLSAAASGRTA